MSQQPPEEKGTEEHSPKKQQNPLFSEILSPHPLPQKLANIRIFLSSGSDPNELDNLSRHQIGRPLHYALSTDAGYDNLKRNLPIIKLLLEAGADPRLRGEGVKGFPTFGQSALDEVKALMGDGNVNGGGEDFKGLKEFYEGAWKEMKRVADGLDGMWFS